MSGGQIKGASRVLRTKNGLHALKALIVDDNRHMRKLLGALLSAYGVKELYEAPDGQSRVKLLRTNKPDLVLTNYDMKPVNGIAFVKMVRNTCTPPLAWVPIILITAHTEIHRIEIARDAGITEVLCKPATPQNLYQRIVEIIERPRRFVKAPEFVGPDRRRRRDAGDSGGPKRRSEDPGDEADYLAISFGVGALRCSCYGPARF
jgi:two-component system chemotaxis response regulator CheY